MPSYLERHGQGHLAVVGGGPSISWNVKKIREWKGEIWSINGAWKWCADRGIKSVFFAADPDPIVLKWAKGATEAILDIRCDPSVFDAVPNVYVYDYADVDARGSTATVAPCMASRIGFLSVTFFGCESSYLPKQSHAYMDEARKEEMIIECDGNDYLTAPDYYIQALELAGQIRGHRSHLFEESGGLLRALINEPVHWIKWMGEGLKGKP